MGTVIANKDNEVLDNGFGYGKLYDYNEDDYPRILFNYLGQLSTDTNKLDDFDLVSINHLVDYDLDHIQKKEMNKDYNHLVFNGIIQDGVLSFRIVANLDEDSLKYFASDYKNNLDGIINYSSDFMISMRKRCPLPANLYTYYDRYVKNQDSKSITPNTPAVLHFTKDFDVFRLKNAILSTINLNNYIKTSFIMCDGEIYQKSNRDYQVDIRVYNKKLAEDIKKEFVKPFNIFEPPLFRFELYYYNGEVKLLMDIHHLITDAFSLNIFLDDLISYYFNNNLNKKEYDYFDYSLETFARDSSKTNKNLIKYFKQNEMKQVQSTKVKKLTFSKKSFADFFREYDIFVDELILSSIVLSLTKLLSMKNIELETIFHGRDNQKYFKAFGYFSRLVPLFFNVNYDISVKDYLNSIKTKEKLFYQTFY
ncbi:MAG: non-ribosomal peptide synthetase partial [Methanobrevibacter sp. CfCl-M3]